MNLVNTEQEQYLVERMESNSIQIILQSLESNKTEDICPPSSPGRSDRSFLKTSFSFTAYLRGAKTMTDSKKSTTFSAGKPDYDSVKVYLSCSILNSQQFLTGGV